MPLDARSSPDSRSETATVAVASCPVRCSRRLAQLGKEKESHVVHAHVLVRGAVVDVTRNVGFVPCTSQRPYLPGDSSDSRRLILQPFS